MNKIIKENILASVLILILSLLVYHFAYGLHTISPSNTAWLLEARHDWGQHYLGWAFFRNDDWTFPLGTVKSWYFPMGTNIGLTDSLPLFAIIFKIFNPLLGDEFQYLGLWIFLCFFLNGYFTNKILNLYNINWIIRFFVILFIITNPVLLYRGLHPALCGQWLIIGSIYIYLRQPKSEKESYKLSYLQGGLILLSGLIHPYLTFIIAGFALIVPLKNYVLYYKTPLIKNVVILLATFIILVANWYIVGLIGSSDSEVKNGYGLYSWNLNSFFNPDGFSSIFPQLEKENPKQYEGYSYFGAGMYIVILSSILILIINSFKSKLPKQKIYLIIIFLLWAIPLTIFGISNVISFNEKILFTYPTPEIVITLGNIFRATSRFIWLIYYAIFLSSLLIIAKSKINNTIKIGVLGLLLILQIYDTKMLFTFRKLNSGAYHPPLSEEKWNTVFREFDHVITYPIYDLKTVNEFDYQDFGYFAALNKATITNAYVARIDSKGEDKFKSEVLEQILNGKIDTKTIYITGENNLKDFVVLINSGNANLKLIDNYYVIYSSQVNLNISQSETDKATIAKALKTNLKPNNFEPTNLPIKPTNNIAFYFEKFDVQNNYVNINGWGLIPTSTNNLKDSIFVVLRDKTQLYIAPMTNYVREDIGMKYNNKNLENAGYTSIVFTKNIKKGTTLNYGLLIKSENQYNYIESEEVVTIGVKLDDDALATKVNLSKEPFILSIDKVEIVEGKGVVFGWTAKENTDNSLFNKEVILEKDKKYFSVNTKNILRDDVVSAKPELLNIQNCGFVTNFNTKSLAKGTYKIGIRLLNDKNQTYTQMSDKTITIK